MGSLRGIWNRRGRLLVLSLNIIYYQLLRKATNIIIFWKFLVIGAHQIMTVFFWKHAMF
jgi:hypothetical protein